MLTSQSASQERIIALRDGHCQAMFLLPVRLVLGAQTQMVGSRQWKSDLRLNGKGKEGSRALAAALFPASAPLLRCVTAEVFGF